jgi:hypothetical protein
MEQLVAHPAFAAAAAAAAATAAAVCSSAINICCA